jgi:hypothetical protein
MIEGQSIITIACKRVVTDIRTFCIGEIKARKCIVPHIVIDKSEIHNISNLRSSRIVRHSAVKYAHIIPAIRIYAKSAAIPYKDSPVACEIDIISSYYYVPSHSTVFETIDKSSDGVVQAASTNDENNIAAAKSNSTFNPLTSFPIFILSSR